MNYSDEPVAVSPDVKHRVSVDVVCVVKHVSNIRKVVPWNTFDYGDPCFDLVRRVCGEETAKLVAPGPGSQHACISFLAFPWRPEEWPERQARPLCGAKNPLILLTIVESLLVPLSCPEQTALRAETSRCNLYQYCGEAL